ncbi:MAG: hypothetical protein AAF630_16015, partial [Cyanobacteria bacterium P01_C01_bin.38]
SEKHDHILRLPKTLLHQKPSQSIVLSSFLKICLQSYFQERKLLSQGLINDALKHFRHIRFTEAEIIQPIEHTLCVTWGMTEFWVDSQGNDRQGFPKKDSC